ncbi:MAG TPA: HAMP domain-containing sensor histidine kinase, partial [Anaerolineales bacterium]|nr:HAMP domain-containing sensor histidine kinase [Anaerolineales bacterium]
TFSAAVISILLAASMGPEAKPRHVLAASAFAVIGSVFFSHGLATPNALIDHFHPAVQWSAWLTLLGGGALFACAALDMPSGGMPSWLPVRGIVYFAAGSVLLYSAVAAFAPGVLGSIESQAASWHALTIFSLTLLLWAFASIRLGLTWRATRDRVDGVLAFVAFWMIAATVSMHRFPVWSLSWWLYHVTLLTGFLITMFVLVQQYEQVRQFRLRRYYLAASLIITAMLALVASALFTQFSYNTIVAQVQSSSSSVASNLANSVATDLSDIATADDLRNLANRSGVRAVFAVRVTGLPIRSILVYDDKGVAAYASEPEWIGVNVENRLALETALRGETVTNIRPPEDPPATYHPTSNIHVIETYSPIHPGGKENSQPIGVLVTVEEVPELNQATLSTRMTGLVTAALTMSLLFIALLLVVGRADRIITSRTQELAAAYTNLRQAAAMRDDLTNMIVHDLRNPLTAISASLELMTKLGGEAQAETKERMIHNAQSASHRMTGMIEDLLTVSKIEAGEFKLQRQPIKLRDLLASAINTFAPQAAADHKTITLDCPPDLTVSLDPQLISRVVENLVGNALKYTDANGKIQVIAHAENGRIAVTVRDSGSGVPDEYKKRIFEKFVQLSDDGSRPLRKGAGLGLAFSSLVVQQHGGEIKVEDAPGGGSDFVFRLPTDKR